MDLRGYGQTSTAATDVLGDAEILAADFGVDRTVAQRAVDEQATFVFAAPSSLVVDGTPLLADPAFWAAHLGGTSSWRQEIAAAFGLTWTQAREAGRPQLLRPDAWPTFTVPLPGGGALLVVHRTDALMTLNEHCVWMPDHESGVDYWLAPTTGPGMLLATHSGHPRGPGLRWPELRAIAAAAPDPLTAAQRLLLLAPCLGDTETGADIETGAYTNTNTNTGIDTDAGPEAVSRLAEALSVVGGQDRTSPAVREAAQTLVHGGVCFEPATWRQVGDTWISDGSVSVRNPFSPHALATEDLLRASAALRPTP